MTALDYLFVGRAKSLYEPTGEEIRRYVLVYDCAMGCYPTPHTDMAKVRDWLLRMAAGR